MKRGPSKCLFFSRNGSDFFGGVPPKTEKWGGSKALFFTENLTLFIQSKNGTPSNFFRFFAKKKFSFLKVSQENARNLCAKGVKKGHFFKVPKFDLSDPLSLFKRKKINAVSCVFLLKRKFFFSIIL